MAKLQPASMWTTTAARAFSRSRFSADGIVSRQYTIGGAAAMTTALLINRELRKEEIGDPI